MTPRTRLAMAVGTLAVLAPALVPAPAFGGPVLGRVVLGVLLAGQVLGMWLLGLRPDRAMALVVVAGAGIQLLVPVYGFGVAVVALCTFAWLRPPRVSLWALAGTVALTLLAWPIGLTWVEAGLAVASAALAWTWGELGRMRTARRREETERAVLAERARIARELHDILAHTVSVMVVQAGAADDVFDTSPTKARTAVRAIEASGRLAQAELRRFLRTVRSDDETAGGPQPGLADLAGLAESVSRAGLDVRLDVDPGEAVAPGVQLSAYRIVQESLTNTLRHARASSVTVTVRVREEDVLVEVRDDGHGGAHREGRGLTGMRERADLLGGSLEAGPRPGGGFGVAARLPLEAP